MTPSRWTLAPDLLVAAVVLEIGDEFAGSAAYRSFELDRERIKQTLRKYFDEGNSYLSFDECCAGMVDIIHNVIVRGEY